MPYGISDKQDDCKGWATVKHESDGSYTTIGCHETKKDAINQMVAVSIAEKMKPEGQRAAEVDLSAPEFMRASAKRGLKLHEEGFSGDGLKPQTVEDARKMASGTITEEKWRKIGAWIARHIVDLDAVQGDEITAGLVAMLLWGGGSSKESARRAQNYAEKIVERLDSVSVRAQNDPNAVICDIDGTLLVGSDPIKKNIAYLNSLSGEIIIVTGRPENQRDETVADLKAAGIKYSRLIMKPIGAGSTPIYKGETAKELLKTKNVTVAIDNDPSARKEYEDAGVKVLDPATITASQTEKKALDMSMPMESDVPVAGEQPEMPEQAEPVTTLDDLADCLKVLLANTFVVSHEAQGSHWNVKGADFSQYHSLFGNIYEDIASSIDPIAENLLKIGFDSPFTMQELCLIATIPAYKPATDALSLASALLECVSALVANLKEAYDCADEAEEDGIANFIAERIDATQKWVWQLAVSTGVQQSVRKSAFGRKN